MTRVSALELVDELHRRQGEMYMGGPLDPVVELLAEDIVWHVPGRSPISAGLIDRIWTGHPPSG